jgi:restriction system protein
VAVVRVKGEKVHFNPFADDVDEHFSGVSIDVINIICKKEYKISYREYLKEAGSIYNKKLLRREVVKMKERLLKDINIQFNKRGISTLQNFAGRANKMDFVIGWESIKESIKEEYEVPGRPTEEIKDIPPEPSPEDPEFNPNYGMLDYILPSRKNKKEVEASKRFKKSHREWKQKSKSVQKYNNRKIQNWKEKKSKYNKIRDELTEKVEKIRSNYKKGHKNTVERVVCAKIKKTDYPFYISFRGIKDIFNQSVDYFYDIKNATLLLNYQLPDLNSIPKRTKLRYKGGKNKFEGVNIDESDLNKIYNNIPYNIALRIIKQIFEFDFSGGRVIENIVFNAFTSRAKEETGNEKAICKISVECSRGEVRDMNLSEADPQAAFEHLGGVSAASMCDASLVVPIIQSDVEDTELMASGRDDDDSEGVKRLMKMDWDGFEHLIVELFKKEFAEEGGELKVTRVSQGEGIDAIAHDADPLRGGTFVIQARRATQTVGASVVQDFHETVTSENANKGVLVTTSDFSPSAHGFAKDKLIQLLNGDDLLRLFGRHGYDAQIDLSRARRKDEQ